ncbi:MAG: UvrD-helicase domain-containing protein [Clostridia bacterium]|nr:UvrD-helicase domain-containing protein [Clostridia bacterium]
MDFSGLNKEQRLAVETLEGPVLILAGAGSGKTRALTYRVANLIEHGVQAWHILALTFTNKAAREMKDRTARLVGSAAAEDAWISTFHATCARILRRDIEKLGYQRSFAIYDTDDQQALLKEILKKLNIDSEYLQVRELQHQIDDAKNRLLSPDEWFAQSSRDYKASRVHDVMTEYEKRMRQLNALDFDDLLLKTLELLADHPPVLQYYQERFQYVLVDEYQDTNKAQYELVRLLTARSRNLCVVGDDDQSIYGWRGADIQNILDFEKDYPDAKVIRLEQNYRSTETILDAANQVIAHNTNRKDKHLWTQIGEGEKIRCYTANDERDEAAWIADTIHRMNREGESLGGMAVLYRTNAQSRVLEETFMRAGIPYMIFGGLKFYERREVKDLIAYLRVLVNPADDISLRRIINVPRRSIGDTTVEMLSEHAEQNEMPLYSAMADLPPALGSRPRKCVMDFFMMMTRLSALKDTQPLTEFIETVIRETGLRAQYEKDQSDEARARIENMEEFAGAVTEFAKMSEEPTLEAFLENVALVTDMDRADTSRDFVTLMTLHSAKGLEFRNVFIAGLEENIFPSFRSVDSQDRLEEERRLMYVGITRAQTRLFLSLARKRTLYNQEKWNRESRFLKEIPDRLMEEVGLNTRTAAFGHLPAARQGTPPRRGILSGRPNLPVARGEIGKPKLTLRGASLDSIPGVQKGFAPSKARAEQDSALEHLFSPGDRVLHRKFGAGVVRSIAGTGAAARIRILFTAYGEKEFALSIAPIVKLED